MRTQQEINQRKALIEAFKKANYSESSINYIVNTYYQHGIESHWEKETKSIIKSVVNQ